MKIFKISADFGFRSFFPYGPEDPRYDELVEASISLGRSTSWSDRWSRPLLHSDSESSPTGNFAHVWGLNGFALDDRAYESLHAALGDYCEFLPFLPYQGKRYCWMNVLEIVDCLDREKTKWKIGRSGKPFGTIEEYRFVPERFTNSSLFRVPKQVALLALTGTSDAQMEFKTLVERSGLTGLKFEEIWSQDGPPIKARGLSDILRDEAQKSNH
jgi:hypothetical protein